MDNSHHHYYDIRGKIGKGKYGTVHQAFQNKPGCLPMRVAIKVAPDSKFSKREAELMASIPPHLNICRFLDTWVLDGKRYIAIFQELLIFTSIGFIMGISNPPTL